MTTAGSSSFGIGIGYLMDDKVKEEDRYTQRQWDRTVGWGKVPEKYDAEEKSQNDPRYPKNTQSLKR